MKTFLIVAMMGLGIFGATAQNLPKVFLLGEHEAAFEKLTINHADMLLTACGDDMTTAFKKWQDMLLGMEEHARDMNYDLKGSKMWFNVFWAPDGQIKHIAYYLKPNSRNIDREQFQLFLISFINQYTLPLAYNKKYAHYGSAAFPLTQPRTGQEEVKKKQEGQLATENIPATGNEDK